MSIPYFDAFAVRAAVPFDRAVRALEEALLAGLDPELDSPRLFSPAPAGEFLIMPTEGARYSGIKAATIAPENPARGLEKIQGIYILFDSATLAPVATMDGAELTAIRTPATTLTAVKHIAAAAPADEGFGTAPQVLVFGAGPQAVNHIRAARAVFPQARFSVIGRRAHRVDGLIRTLAAEGIQVQDASGAMKETVAVADVILCVTSSPTPLFDGSLPRDGAIIASVGQHGLDTREVDETLVRRSDIVVEGRASAWRESGDLIPARSVADWQEIHPPNLQDLVLGRLARRPGTCCLFTGVGMAWEDLVTAAVVYEEGRKP
ncbi:ornithine cyclodeaminase family protein [Arthrobacter yangruifuii]|uniref:ornithine cyclodeaminase family protein n=1 Tax=Arthrobacter yangruifuii TaxID=2606616 RepID=UPI0011B4BBFB|nr:ornithine cyclodeaminase family protein [Arthrobacter yangruifuii]